MKILRLLIPNYNLKEKKNHDQPVINSNVTVSLTDTAGEAVLSRVEKSSFFRAFQLSQSLLSEGSLGSIQLCRSSG